MSWMGEDDYLYFNNHTIETELTPQQFMEGEVPGPMGAFDHALLQDRIEKNEAGKAKKPDAYIGGHPVHIIYLNNSGDKDSDNVREAYKYNILSEEDFKAKHTPQLKFKEWKVTVGDKSVKIGCQEFRKVDAERFTEFVTRCRSDHSAHSLSMDEVFDFIMDHKKELGL